MSGAGDPRGYAAWRLLLLHAGVGEAGMVDELALWSWGFEERHVGASELWEDPEDPAAAGGVWIGRQEALRRIGVRAAQGHRPSSLPDGWLRGGDAEGIP